jgi:hypothetical protein
MANVNEMYPHVCHLNGWLKAQCQWLNGYSMWRISMCVMCMAQYQLAVRWLNMAGQRKLPAKAGGRSVAVALRIAADGVSTYGENL